MARIFEVTENMADGEQKVKPENNDGGVGDEQITITVKQQGSRTKHIYFASGSRTKP